MLYVWFIFSNYTSFSKLTPSPTPDFKSFVANDCIEYMLNQLLDYIARDYAITKIRIYKDKVLDLQESFLFNRDPSQW